MTVLGRLSRLTVVRCGKRPCADLAQGILLSLAAFLLVVSPLPAELIHHWALDETSGGVAVDSVGSNHGIWQDGAGTNLAWESGIIGNAAHLSDPATGAELQHFDVGIAEGRVFMRLEALRTGGHP